MGDPHAKLSNWLKNDRILSEGLRIVNIFSQHGFRQIVVNELTHILETRHSNIDFIFTSH